MSQQTPEEKAKECFEFYFLGLGHEIPVLVEKVTTAIQSERDTHAALEAELAAALTANKGFVQMIDVRDKLFNEKHALESRLEKFRTILRDVLQSFRHDPEDKYAQAGTLSCRVDFRQFDDWQKQAISALEDGK